MQLSNHLDLMYKTDSVDTQVQILTENFLLALDSCAPLEEINEKAVICSVLQTWIINRSHKNKNKN